MKVPKGLKTKLFAAVAIVVLFFAGLGITNLVAAKAVAKNLEHIVDENLKNTTLLMDMSLRFQEIRVVTEKVVQIWEDKSERRKLVGVIEDNISSYERIDKEYRETNPVGPELAAYNLIVENWKEAKASIDKLIKAEQEDQTPAQAKAAAEDFRFSGDQWAVEVRKAISYQTEDGRNWAASAKSSQAYWYTITLLLCAIGSLLVAATGWIFATRLSHSLSKVAKDVSNTAGQVATSSEQLTSASYQVSAGSTESAASLEETVASIEQIASMVKQNADNASQASVLSQQSCQVAEGGEVEIRNLISSMTEISASSKKIEEIINVIDDIAFQTNLLALNAAVEAARAGEQGKGFAVVAEAVRTLAQRSAVAAKDINTLIKDSVDKIDHGSDIADKSGEVLRNIVTSIRKVADLNLEISVASQEQSNGISQIGRAMNQLDVSTQQNATASEQVASASEEMSSQAQILKSLLGELNMVIFGYDRISHVSSDEHHQDPHQNVVQMTPHHRKTKDPRRAQEKPDASRVIPFDNDGKNKIGTTDGF
jgi:hypothetical protein